MQKLLIIVGTLLLFLGLLWPYLQRIRIGQLPGDMMIKHGHFTIYLPLATSLLLSLLVSLLMWVINR